MADMAKKEEGSQAGSGYGYGYDAVHTPLPVLWMGDRGDRGPSLLGNKFDPGHGIAVDERAPREAEAMKDAAIGRQAVMADDKTPGRRDAREKEFPWMVKSIIRHTHYIYARNDIALLQLDCPFNFSKSDGRILSLPFAPRGHRVTGRVKFAGWGAEERNGPKSAVLRAGFLKISSEDTCRKTYKIYGRKQFFCAGDGGGNACTLDGGGAAVQKLSGVFVLVGISEHFGDCRKQPSLFLRIEKYYDWINENIPVLWETDIESKQTAGQRDGTAVETSAPLSEAAVAPNVANEDPAADVTMADPDDSAGGARGRSAARDERTLGMRTGEGDGRPRRTQANSSKI
ncbi:serine protease, putative [Ixodes scapularis]|uniref:Serine protease, putative n=1 Tax=Ixodes scapularis TaxID=6945 RepID=B7P341_IXOSC|nr:serine protease, putative [Ixodes scapularis]|eukprot:XP_002403539.1 serine protease, putative [Ixodes scapularis]